MRDAHGHTTCIGYHFFTRGALEDIHGSHKGAVKVLLVECQWAVLDGERQQREKRQRTSTRSAAVG